MTLSGHLQRYGDTWPGILPTFKKYFSLLLSTLVNETAHYKSITIIKGAADSEHQKFETFLMEHFIFNRQ